MEPRRSYNTVTAPMGVRPRPVMHRPEPLARIVENDDDFLTDDLPEPKPLRMPAKPLAPRRAAPAHRWAAVRLVVGGGFALLAVIGGWWIGALTSMDMLHSWLGYVRGVDIPAGVFLIAPIGITCFEWAFMPNFTKLMDEWGWVLGWLVVVAIDTGSTFGGLLPWLKTHAIPVGATELHFAPTDPFLPWLCLVLSIIIALGAEPAARALVPELKRGFSALR